MFSTKKSPQLLETITVPAGGEAFFSVIWLHGLGANGHDFVPVIEELSPRIRRHTRFIFPHAPIRPVTLNQGMRMPAWYDIVSIDLKNRVDMASLKTSQEQINLLIKEEVASGIPAKRVFLGGFSQGAALSLHTGIHYGSKLGGIVALSGYLPESDIPAGLKERSPVFIAHGSYDPVVPIHLGREAGQTLELRGFEVEKHEYPMLHMVSPEEITDLNRWLELQMTKTIPPQFKNLFTA